MKLLGSQEPEELVKIPAEVAGSAREALFNAGDHVTPETVLVRIDPDRYRPEADTAATRAALGLALKNRERSNVRSPRPGAIDARTVEVGPFAPAGNVLATVVDPRVLRLRCKVSESESLAVRVGQAVSFRNLVVSFSKGAPVRLEDVAVVEDGLEDRRRLVRAMGESSIGFGITKLRGANAVQVGRDVKAKIETLKAQLPEGLTLEVNRDTTTLIERSIHETLFTLVLAALLTGLVCRVFPGSWSTTQSWSSRTSTGTARPGRGR